MDLIAHRDRITPTTTMLVERISRYIPTSEELDDEEASHSETEQQDVMSDADSAASLPQEARNSGYNTPLPLVSRHVRQRGLSMISEDAHSAEAAELDVEHSPSVSSPTFQIGSLNIGTLAIGPLPGASSVLESLIADLHADDIADHNKQACCGGHVHDHTYSEQGYEADNDNSSATSWETLSEVEDGAIEEDVDEIIGHIRSEDDVRHMSGTPSFALPPFDGLHALISNMTGMSVQPGMFSNAQIQFIRVEYEAYHEGMANNVDGFNDDMHGDHFNQRDEGEGSIGGSADGAYIDEYPPINRYERDIFRIQALPVDPSRQSADLTPLLFETWMIPLDHSSLDADAAEALDIACKLDTIDLNDARQCVFEIEEYSHDQVYELSDLMPIYTPRVLHDIEEESEFGDAFDNFDNVHRDSKFDDVHQDDYDDERVLEAEGEYFSGDEDAEDPHDIQDCRSACDDVLVVNNEDEDWIDEDDSLLEQVSAGPPAFAIDRRFVKLAEDRCPSHAPGDFDLSSTASSHLSDRADYEQVFDDAVDAEIDELIHRQDEMRYSGPIPLEHCEPIQETLCVYQGKVYRAEQPPYDSRFADALCDIRPGCLTDRQNGCWRELPEVALAY